MYTNYNIPQNRYYKPENYYRSSPTTTTTYYQDEDRFFGGGFLAPFLLGGVGGYLLGRPNYQQGPIPVYFPSQPMPYPYPPYSSNTNIYY